MKLKIKIPAVVSETGNVSAAFYRSRDGGEHQDIGLLWDDLPEGEKSRLIHIEAEVDVEALFESANIHGTVATPNDRLQ